MRNIEFKGTLKGDVDQISSGKPMPEGSVMFKEPETSDKAFAQGMIFAGPLMLAMLIISLVRIIKVFGPPYGMKFGSFMIAFLVSMVFIVVSQYIHEYIHAFAFSKDIKKQIYVMPQNQMLFVYVEDPVPKVNFLISVLSPAFILGIIPFIVWVFIMPHLPLAVSFGIVIYTIFMTGCALGDYLNAYNCIRQVPKGAKVFNRGWHSYWVR